MFNKIRTLALATIACLLSFGVAAQTPAGWTPVTTDNNMTVMIPAAVLNGSQIPVGSIIGAFYTLDDGTERCGGAWEFTGTFPISVSVFGDDGLTAIKDGFTAGEEVIWKLYYNGTEYYGDDFVQGPIGPPSPANNVSYIVNGLVNGLVTIVYTGAPTTEYLITGTILKESGSALRNATVDVVTGSKEILRAYTDHLGTYRLYVAAGTSGSVVPSMATWGFVPAEQQFTNIGTNWGGVDFTAVQLTVSGTILNTSGDPMQNVSVGYVSQDGLTTSTESTNAAGFYEFNLGPGATGTITPSYTDYSGYPFITYYFNPASIAVTDLSASLTGQDFVGSPNPFFVELCGNISNDDGSPIVGVDVTFVSSETTYTETVQTDAAGDYCFTVDFGESGVITPAEGVYVYNPPTIAVTDVEANATDLNFTGIIPVATYSICGRAETEEGTGIEGVTVSFNILESTDVLTAVTDSDGNYCITGVEEGTSGSMSAEKTGYTFAPLGVLINNVVDDIENVIFIGTLETYEISGVVTDNETKGALEGVTVSLTGFDDVITGTDGAFSFTVDFGFDGTLTPAKEGYSFAPAQRTYADVAEDKLNQDFVGALFTHLISGTITLDGNPLENVEVTFSGNAGVAYTDASGYYSNTVTYGYSGTSMPVLDGYVFDPVSYSYTSVEADIPDQDFLASPSEYTISGMITMEGTGVENVAVNFSNGAGTVYTDATGYYEIVVDINYTGVATPVLEGYDFIPTSISYTDVTMDYADQDYEATTTMYLVSGTISESAKAGVPGVTVDFGMGIESVLTNSSGYYEQYVPYNWTGVITPTKVGWVFTPETISLEGVVADTPDQDFTGEVETFIVSGFITDAISGAAINAVNVSFTGAGNTTTGASGYYAMAVPYDYTGVITPEKPGYTFTPETIALANVTDDTPAQNFAANEILFTISGTILDPTDAPVEDVLITFSNGGGSVITDVNGDYSLQVSYGYTGTATPLKTGYIFNPVNIAYNFVTADAADQDYLGAPVPPESYMITGTVIDESSAPMAGVSVVFTNGGGTATTDANGDYSIELYGGYTGEATPSYAGYFFDPVSIPLVNLDADHDNLDFQGMPSTLPPGWNYTITGSSHLISVPATINPTINGIDLMPGDWVGVFFMDGATEVCGGAIMWNGISAVAVTAYGDDNTTGVKDGFTELENLNWKVYSQTAGMSFDAVATYNTSMPQFDGLFHTNGLSALTGLVATGETYTISGMINNIAGNAPMSGVTVTLNNGGGYALTDVTGYYEIEVLPNWEGTATPFYMGYHFSPESIDYTAVAADIPDQDYIAAINYYTISGYITTTEGAGLPGVTIFFDNDGGSSISFPDGFYTRTVPYGYTGTAYPSLEGYSFEPETYAYSIVSDDYADQDYTASIANLPPGWGYTPTVESHVISIPLGANPNINGVPLFPGDWIGVFYMDEGVEKCGGAAEWDGGVNIPLIAYGDDETTPEKDGFEHGVDEFTWRVYSYAAEMQFDDITVEYDENVQNFDGIYYNNGLSALLSLNGATDVTYTVSGVVTDVADGTPMENVLIDLGDGGSTLTDATGYYEIEVLFGWIGSAEAVYPRYSFDPVTYGFYQVIGEQENKDFEGTRYPYPPGWEYNFTDTEHTVSVMSFANPTIDGTALEVGDFIGVFYYDVMTGEERCAGYAEWTGANTAVVVYGDDATTPEKDGMTVGEPFRWKVYSWTNAMEYEAIANYDLTPPYIDGFFTVNGLSRVVNMYADPLTIFATATPEVICYNTQSQLEVSAAGGSGLYEYSWIPAANLSDPNIANPVATLTETTTFTVTVNTFQYTEMETVTVTVHPMFEVTGGDAQTICYNTAPADLYATATGGAGTYAYQWQQDVEGVWTDITDATAATFNPGALTETTDFRCEVTDDCGVLYTPVITITVYDDLAAVAGDDQTICYNTAPEALLVSPTGGAGNYTYQWYMDGVAIENGTGATYQPEALMVTTEYYCEVTDDCGMVMSNTVTITVYEEFVASIAADQTICYNTVPEALTSTVSGGMGEYTYQWYEGETAIEGATAATYQPEALMATTTYYLVVTDYCGVITTNEVTITVYDEFVASIAADQTICYNTVPEALTSTVSGGMGEYTYQWYEGETAIEGATAATYQPEALMATTTYYLVVTDYCGVITTNEVTITVYDEFVASIAADQTICYNTVPEALTSTVSGGMGEYTYQWYEGETAIEGATAATYQPEALMATTTYYLVVTDYCGVITTNEVTITVYDEFVASIAADQTICYNTVPEALTSTVSGGMGEYTYQWYEGETAIEGATAATYQPEALMATTTYYLVVTDYCGVITTNEVTITVYDEFVASIAADQTICYNTVPEALTSTVSGGMGEYTYQWYEGETAIEGATAATYQPEALMATTTYYLVVTDYCGVITTNEVTITVYEDLAATAAADQTICYGTAPEPIVATATGGAGNYTYQWQVEGEDGFINIENASDATYQPETIYAATNYQCVVTDDCGTVTTNVVNITMYEEFLATAAADQVICYGTTPEPIVATATGGLGNYTYQWQIEGEDGFINIENASDATYQPETIYAETDYQCVVTDFCGTVTTNVVSITMYEDVVVTIAADQLICYFTAPEPLTSVVTGGAGNYTYQWQIEGEEGFMDIEGATDATYQPEALTGEAHYQLVVTDDCGTFISNMVMITIIPLPTADAGDDQYVCEADDVQLDGYAENAGSVMWTTSGDGTFVDATSSDAVYMPGVDDVDAGSVVLTFTAYAVEPCTDSDMDMVTIDFAPSVTANAGEDATICEGDTYQTMGFTTAANSVMWSTAGDGTFDNPTSIAAVYTPGTADIASESVILTMGAEPIGPCTQWAYDDVEVTIVPSPTVNAGPDATICGTSTHVLSATATNYMSALWTTDGDGTFDNPSNNLTAEYTPGANDIANGGATLTLTITGYGPCYIELTDEVVLSIIPLPEVFAGEDAFTCEGLAYTIADATAANASIMWTTNGTGTFDDPTLENPTYTPSGVDLAMGVVTLTMTGTNGDPCNDEVMDSMELTVQNAPTINGGPNQDLCENDVADLYAIAENYLNVEWTTTGDGTFGDPTLLETAYTPGTNDIAGGEVVLTITAYGESVCGNISDDVIVTIAMRPDVFAGEDTKVCEGESIEMTEATADNYVTVLWTTAGDGTFDDATAVNPVYTPGDFDIMYGSVELTITAEAFAACGGNADDAIVVSIDKAPEQPDMPMGDEHTCVYTVSSLYEVDAVTGANGYTWEISPEEAGTIEGAGAEATVTWNADFIGSCVIRVKAFNDCGESVWSDGIEVLHDECVGIDEGNDILINIFPNPTTGVFTVTIEGLNEGVNLSVMNYDGRLIHTETLENVSNYEHNFNFTQYPTGVYFLRLQGDNFLKVERIVVR